MEVGIRACSKVVNCPSLHHAPGTGHRQALDVGRRGLGWIGGQNADRNRGPTGLAVLVGIRREAVEGGPERGARVARADPQVGGPSPIDPGAQLSLQVVVAIFESNRARHASDLLLHLRRQPIHHRRIAALDLDLNRRSAKAAETEGVRHTHADLRARVVALKSLANVLGKISRRPPTLRARDQQDRHLGLVGTAQRASRTGHARLADNRVQAADLRILAQLELHLLADRIGRIQRGRRRHGQREVQLALVAAREKVQSNHAGCRQRDTRRKGRQSEADDHPATRQRDAQQMLIAPLEPREPTIKRAIEARQRRTAARMLGLASQEEPRQHRGERERHQQRRQRRGGDHHRERLEELGW